MKFSKRRKKPLTRVNITPLIDINANLLFFMMISASVQEDRLEAGDAVELPSSTSRRAQAGDLISIVVATDHVSVNEIEVMKLDQGVIKKRDIIRRSERVRPLYKELRAKFQDLVQEEGAQPGAEGEDKLPVILVQADKSLPYQTLSRIMRTCGQAGFTKFRFAAKERVTGR